MSKFTKVQDVLLGNRKQGGPTLEEARAAMITAGELPRGLSTEHKKNAAVVVDGQPVVQATPTVVRTAASQRAAQAPITGPTEIVAILTYVDGEAEEIVVENREALVALVDGKSKQLKDAGQPTRIHVTYKVRPKTETDNELVVDAADAVDEAKVVPKTNLERSETKDFTATIKQENGKWIGELVYKNGAGTERFVADSKNALTMQMLIGKGNASVKVRKVIREQKYGVELDKSYLFPTLTQEQYDSMPEQAKQELVDAAALKASVTFKQQHPEYYSTAENWDKIKRFLDKRELPYTYVNLEYAYAELTDDQELAVRQEPTVTHVLPKVEDSTKVAPVATQPTVASTPTLRKRGTTGIVPGTVSTGSDVLNVTEESTKPRELSDAELKALPLSEHKKLYRASLKTPNRQY